MSERLFSIREIPRGEWPRGWEMMESNLSRVWLCDEYLVQAYEEAGGIVRLTVSGTRTQGRSWVDRISWDVLQALKRRVGYGDQFAVEVYPADDDVVNVANMRHLWLLTEAPAFAWRKEVRTHE